MLKLVNLLKSFKNEESGAVTVDWVVLTGAVVAMALLIGTTVGGAIDERTEAIADIIETGAALQQPAPPANP